MIHMPTLQDLLEEHKNNKRDKKVFGLVIQGGGMRAAYAAGALITLVEYDLAESFDQVIGSSAGAINGVCFVSKKPDIADTYVNDLTDKKFVNLLRRDKKIDVDYAIDVVMKQKHPLNMHLLNRSKTKIHIIVTNAETGKKVIISNHHAFAQIYEELRATSALPILYDKPVLIAGKYYVDGAVADSIPIDVAMKLGCTDIVVIMNLQSKGYKFDRRHQRLVKHLIKRFAKNYTTALRNKLPTDEHLLQVNLRRIIKPHKKFRIYLLEPSDEQALISMGTIDKEKVRELAELGTKDMDTFLDKEIVPKNKIKQRASKLKHPSLK